jgi:hypothetical protein
VVASKEDFAPVGNSKNQRHLAYPLPATFYQVCPNLDPGISAAVCRGNAALINIYDSLALVQEVNVLLGCKFPLLLLFLLIHALRGCRHSLIGH